jgi:predicted nucleic acid-binding protein
VITAVDTNVLLDVFGADPTFGLRSKDALRMCAAQGALVACDAVWSEVAAAFESAKALQLVMQRLGVKFDAVTPDTALAAGTEWGRYRRHGWPRSRVVADFLIGAHAQLQADRLLTRDRGFYHAYFTRLALVDPTGSP